MQSYIVHGFGQEKNRINKDGELVISSTKTRTQKLTSFLFSFMFSILLLFSKHFNFTVLLQG